MKKIELLSAEKAKNDQVKHQESWIDEDYFKQFNKHESVPKTD